jgi:hypothetical protein
MKQSLISVPELLLMMMRVASDWVVLKFQLAGFRELKELGAIASLYLETAMARSELFSF